MAQNTATKSKAEIEYIRRGLLTLEKEGKIARTPLAHELGVNHANLSRCLNGKQGLSDETAERIYEKGVLPRPAEEDLRKKEHQPMETWDGSVKTVKEAAKEKGYSEGTIRKYLKNGKLNYIRVNRRLYVVVDEQYERLPKTKIGYYRAENIRLRRENTRLRKALEAKGVFPEEEIETRNAAGTPDLVVELSGQDVVEPPEVDTSSSTSVQEETTAVGTGILDVVPAEPAEENVQDVVGEEDSAQEEETRNAVGTDQEDDEEFWTVIEHDGSTSEWRMKPKPIDAEPIYGSDYKVYDLKNRDGRRARMDVQGDVFLVSQVIGVVYAQKDFKWERVYE